jgi:hypothetical protein
VRFVVSMFQRMSGLLLIRLTTPKPMPSASPRARVGCSARHPRFFGCRPVSRGDTMRPRAIVPAHHTAHSVLGDKLRLK